MSLDSIVNVQITKGTKSVSQAGFGTAMVLGLHTRFAERIRFYESMADVIADFQTSDSEYKAANALFAQEKKPERIAIGRRTAAVAQVITWTPTVVNATLYTVTINGTAHSYTSDGSATDLEIVAGLLALINAGAQASKVTASGTTTLIVTSDAAGEAFTYSATSNLAAVVTFANHGVQEDIAAVIEESDDWYCLLLTSRTALDIRLAAASIEALRKIFLACSDEAGVLTSGTTDIAYVLKALTYARTAYLWSDDQANYPEAAWAGRLLPDDPGSETWKFKTLAGVTASVLTPSEVTNAEGKNANLYTEVGGVSITSEGIMVGGEFIDVTRFIDWVHARIQEGVYSRLVNLEKIPFTDAGVAVIEAEIRKVLLSGVRVGGIAPDPEFEVTAPLVADISTADKGTRTLPDVKFNFTLAGAIHAVEVNGIVQV